MGNYIIVILLSAVLFLAIVLQLAAKPKFAARVTGACMVIAGISGLLLYGYGYAAAVGHSPLAIVRTLLAVCGMYVGKIDFSSISGAPIFGNVWVQFYFYLVHLLALYATASTAIAAVGAEALQKLRMWLARRGNLNLIYGINDASLDFGKALLSEKKGAVIFVDKAPDPAAASAITKAGGAVRSDDNALKATAKFLRAIGLRPGSRKITVYTMHTDPTENLPYAEALLQTMQTCQISPRQTSLVIPATEDGTARGLQVLGEHYGYGYVTCYREPELAARLLTRLYPPCDTMYFDGLGRTTNSFDSVLIGFGKTGQAVLRQLVMNGQFVGSTFSCHVFDPVCFTANGFFDSSSGDLLSSYNIVFHDCDAHSKPFYDYILTTAHNLNYVVVAAGSEKTNREIAEDLSAMFHRLGLNLPIYLCSHKGVSCCTADGSFTKLCKLYQPSVLSSHTLDRMAMELNASYQGDPDKSPIEHWMHCDYFSRMSCRASADFVPAILRAAGKTEEDVLSGQWEFSEAQLDVLGKTEHLRWNAFHHCMGFTTMTDEEFDSRAAAYLRQKETNPNTKNNIRKNMERRTHACLIPWEALDDYSRKENAITGGTRDYRYEDTGNILTIPTLIKRSKEEDA